MRANHVSTMTSLHPIAMRNLRAKRDKKPVPAGWTPGDWAVIRREVAKIATPRFAVGR